MNLLERITEQLPELLKQLDKQDLPDGIIDIRITQTWFDEQADECNSVEVGMELVQLVDDTWELEDMYVGGKSVLY